MSMKRTRIISDLLVYKEIKQIRSYKSIVANFKTNILLLTSTHYKYVPTIELTVGDANTLARISS